MKKTNLDLLVFTVMSFVLAMTAFVFNGILDQVALDLKVSVARTGLLNATYAYGAAFGTPITLIVFRKIERTKMLKLMLAATVLMTLLLVLAQNFDQMLAVRLFMGISANSYGVLAIGTVVSMAPKDRQGRAMAFLITGSSLALVIGIPLTRALSSVLDWQSIFWILNGIMIMALIYFLLFLPATDHEATRFRLGNELKYLKDGNVLMIIAFTLIMFVGYGAFYNFATPYLLILFPSAESGMSYILLLFGISSFIGNLVGGHISDRIGYKKSMLIGGILLFGTSLVISRSQSIMWLTILMTVIWLAGAWFTGLQLNTGIAQATHNRSSLMISLNSAAIQLGGALGSSIAVVVIERSIIHNIILITLAAGVGMMLVQFISLRKYPDKAYILVSTDEQ